jgi:ABC-2 type transport system ATP-binding protein
MGASDRGGTSVRDTAAERGGAEDGEIAVELKGVSKTFRQKQPSERMGDVLKNLVRPKVRVVHALSGIDLTIRRGEVVAYAGPNGAGKSTTVKLLSGMLVPDAGTVRSLGMDPSRERVRYVGRIGVVFGQRTELWWDHPVAASFEWKRVVWDIPRATFERTSAAVREALGLDEFFHSMARELSLGQRMRADLGLALLHEPEILFLDEPTIGLDVLAKRNILEFIRGLNRERGVTVMVTSHDMGELEELAGRIVMVHHGRLAFDGDFGRLRRETGDRRILALTMGGGGAPELPGAELVRSEGNRHEYGFDASRVGIGSLLEAAGTQGEVRDVETHRAPIDEVIADIYQAWQGERVPTAEVV